TPQHQRVEATQGGEPQQRGAQASPARAACLLDDAPGHPGAEDGADHGKSAGQAEEAHQCGDLNAHQCGPGEASPLASPFGQGLKASTAMMMKMPITGTRWSSE